MEQQEQQMNQQQLSPEQEYFTQLLDEYSLKLSQVQHENVMLRVEINKLRKQLKEFVQDKAVKKG